MRKERINHDNNKNKICVLERKEEERITDLKKFMARGSVFQRGGPVFIGTKKSRCTDGGSDGLDELGEGGKEVVSKIREFGGDIGSELLRDRGGEVLFGGGEGGEGGRL
ncbi:hypothetical protein Tco_0110858 [Tanacetum coccineum]